MDLDEGLLAELRDDRPLHRGRRVAVVHDRVVPDLVVEPVAGTMRRGHARDHALHGIAHLGAARDRQRPHRPADAGGAGDHVPGGAGCEGRDGNDDRVERVGLARDDLLETGDHLRRHGDGVDRLVRVRAVTSAGRGSRG